MGLNQRRVHAVSEGSRNPATTSPVWEWKRSSFVGIPGLFAMVAFCMADSLQVPAMQSPLASKALLTASARAGDRVVAVGAYGDIVYSGPAQDGKGVEWQQAKVPTQRLLTTVTFVGDRAGWAGGHDTLILHTTDSGENWEIQHEDPMPGGDVPKPILDIVFTDELHGIAVGAFSLLLATSDGGETWTPIDTSALYDMLEDQELEPEPNFNAISKLNCGGNGYLIVGELGTLLKYNDKPDAETWRIIKSPYAGSFFGLRQLSSGDILLYGLRGHLYRSSDCAETWTEIRTDTIANIYDTIELSDSSVIAVGSSGTILRVGSGEVIAEKIPYVRFNSFTSVQDSGNGELLLFGDAGSQSLLIEQSVTQ